MGAIASFITDELEAKNVRNCKVCVILSKLDDEDRSSMEQVIAARALSYDKISLIFRKANHSVSPTSIQRHTANCVTTEQA